MVGWYQDAVVYELHVRAYHDSNGDGVGDFTGLTRKLDHLADLGITAVWLLPFYPSPLRDDGYDIADYTSVNPAYGDMRSFRRFLRAAHEREIRVITELVINHTSDQHPWFGRARQAPEGSTHRDFYVWSDTTERYADARIIFSDFEHSNWTWDPVAGAHYWHRFYSHQPDLNFDNPAVEAAVVDVLDFWLSMGVDGLRLDAVPYLYEREGTNCENLAETHALLKRLRAHVDANYDDRMLLAEANQWPEDAAEYFGDGDECHMNFHFPVMPRLFMALQMENRTPIVDILEQTPVPPEGCQWATFLRNHDELTLEMVTDEERDYMVRAYAIDPQMRINLGIRRRLAPLLENDRRKIELLNALLLSLPGTPVLYYGDEIGMGDNIYLGDRASVRTPMQWSPDRNAGFSSANPHRLYLPVITEPGYHYENVNVEAQASNPSSILLWMRQILALRKRYPVLSTGDVHFLEPEQSHVLAFVRSSDGESPMLVVANMSRLAQHVELDLRPWTARIPVEVFGQTRFAQIGESPYHVTLASHGFFWLSLEPPASTETDAGSRPRLAADVLARPGASLNRALQAWLPDQRWFAAKGRRVREVVTDDVVVVSSDPALSVILATVRFDRGEDHQYCIPIAHVDAATAVTTALAHSSAVIGRDGDQGAYVDALVHEASTAELVRIALTRRRPRGRSGHLQGSPRQRGLEALVDDPQDVHLLSGEQSNTSAIIGGRVIAKVVRRLEPGDNPDVEVPAFLRSRAFANVPGLVASVEYRDGVVAPRTIMVVHDAVPNEGDLWLIVGDELSRLLELASSDQSRRADEASSMSLELVDLLGQRTAELHEALRADGPFRPEPFTLLHQRSLLQNIRSSWRETRGQLVRWRAVTELGDELADVVDSVLARGDDLLAPLHRLRTDKLAAERIRIHGDLHLGQVLRTARDLVFIDFEGEPSRPLGDRRIKRSPLVDVAGLLRSLDYAARVALATASERGRLPGDVTGARSWALDWRDRAQRRLVASYIDNLVSEAMVPGDRADLELLLDTLTVEKALYEVRYELSNRPDWVGWPLAAIDERLTVT